MNNFMLTFSPYLDKPSHGQLLNHVQTSRFVAQYYQPYAGTFLLKSFNDAQEVANSIHGLFDGAAYMLVQVNSDLVGGNLSHDAWNWLNYGVLPTVPPAPPVEKPVGLGRGLGALLGDSNK